MNKRTIKVDLSLFFDDERKMSYIFVDPYWKIVACLQRRVEHLFDISSVCLSCDGCYLPPNESVEILEHCEIVKAFVPKESQELRKKKKSKKRKEILEKSISEEALVEEISKAKDANDELVSSTRGVNVTSTNSLKTNELLEGFNKKQQLSSSQNSGNSSKKRKNDNSSLQKVGHNVQQLLNSQNPINPNKKLKSDTDEIMTTKRLHNIASSTLLNDGSLLEEGNNTQQLSNSEKPKNPFKNGKSNKSHIHFDETGDILNSKSTNKKGEKLPSKADEKSGVIVVFRCPLNDVTNSDDAQPQKPRIFHLMSKKAKAKQLIEIQEDVLLTCHSLANGANETFASNEATITDNVETDTSATLADALNNSQTSIISIIAQTEKEKQVSAKNFNGESQNGETTSNESVNESRAIKDVTEEASNVHKTEFSYVDETAGETQNENQKELSTCTNGNRSTTQNKLQIDRKSVGKSNNDAEVDLTNIEDQTSETEAKTADLRNQNNSMSVDLHDDECNKSSESDVEEVSEIIDLNESEYNPAITLNKSKQKSMSFEELTVPKILPLSRDLTNLPSSDDIIIFKVPYKKNKMNAKTEFVAGRVQYVNKRTKNIKISVLDGISELSHIPANFVCDLDESNENVDKCLQLKFSDMLELKLFSVP